MDKTIGRVEFLAQLEPSASKADLLNIHDAYSLAKYGHRGQWRDQGGRYFEHPKAVALIIIQELGIYVPDLIIMALLHDVLEDTFVLSARGLKRLFGTKVINGLQVLTNYGDKQAYLEGLNKCSSTGVLIVKFADRLHNLRTMDGVRPEKKQKKFIETKEHYLPLLQKAINRANQSDKRALRYLQTQIKSILAEG